MKGKLIFVVLGTQKFQCNRLLKQIDRLVEEQKITDPVFAQKGHSDYIPQYYPSVDFLNKEDFEQKMEECSLLITHSGVGTILLGIRHGKPVIVFPRLKKYKEHVDDHQWDIAKAFGKKHLVLVCGEEDSLENIIRESETFDFQPYESHRAQMLQTIETYLREEIENV